MNTAYIGCDPGRSGAIAVLVENKILKVFSWTDDLHQNFLNIVNSLASIEAYFDGRPYQVRAVIEQVHAMPKQGVRSTFTFGQAYGEMLQALACAGIGFEQVTPAKWQREIGLKKPSDDGRQEHKRKLAAAARQLYPSVHFNIPQADAVLLAHWLKEKLLRGLVYNDGTDQSS